MAHDGGTPISKLPPASALDGSETFCCVQAGQTRKTRLSPTTSFLGAAVFCNQQIIPGGITQQVVIFSSKLWDTAGMVDLSGPVFTAPYTGFYRVEGWASWGQGNTSGTFRSVYIKDSNSFLISQNDAAPIVPDTDSQLVQPVVGTTSIGVGGTIDLYGETDATGDTSFAALLEIQFLGAAPTSPPPPPPPPTVYFLDTFAGSPGTGVPPHTPNTDVSAAGWTAIQGTFALATGGCQSTSDVDEDSDTFSATVSDYTLTAVITMSIIDISNYRSPAVEFRSVDLANHWIMYPSPNDGSSKLYLRVGGTYTAIDSQPFTWVDATDYTLKLVLAGSSIMGYIDGTLIHSVTNASFQTAIRAGMRLGVQGAAPPCTWVSITAVHS